MNPTEPKRATEVDPGKTAKFLANLQRTVAKRDPDDPPAARPAAARPAVVPSSFSSDTEPKPEPKAEAKPEPKPQARTEPKPEAKPRVAVTEDEADFEEEPQRTPVKVRKPARRKPVRRQAGRDDEDRVSMEINLDPGTGKRVVYVRVDKTLADRLQLIAFQNKIAGGDGPTTINEIGIEALLDWIDRYEGRAAA